MDKDNKNTNKILVLDRKFSLIWIFAILILFIYAYYITSHPSDEKFTEFYLLGPGGNAYDYPTNLTVGETGKVIIGIVNHEGKQTDYKLLIKTGNLILDSKNITLSDKEKWESNYTFTVIDNEDKIEFLLYKQRQYPQLHFPNTDNVYRSLYLKMKTN